MTKAFSPSKASQSSSQIAKPSSSGEEDELTRAMISARREASTKRRTRSSPSPCRSGEGGDHDGVAAISLCSSDTSHLPSAVEAGKRREALPERGAQRGGLGIQRLPRPAEGAAPADAVEHERSAGGAAIQRGQRVADRGPGAADDGLGGLLGELDGAVDRDVGRADQPAFGPLPEHLAQPDIAAQLGLSERMGGGESGELVVAEALAGAAQLGEVDRLGGQAVELHEGATVG